MIPNQSALAKIRLKQRERQFVRALVKCRFNAAAAAREIGYSEHNAPVVGCELLARPHVRAEMERLRQEMLDLGTAQVHEVLANASAVATSNIADLVEGNGDDFQIKPFDQMTDEQRRSIAEIRIDTTGGTGDGERRRVLRTTLKLHPKIPALELLMKFHGLLIERQQHDHVIHVEVAERLRSARKRLAEGRIEEIQPVNVSSSDNGQ